MSAVRIVNFAEIADPEWTFLKDSIKTKDVSWSFHSASPRYWLERVVKRPNLARLRASLHVGFLARGTAADVIVSHLPRATLWAAMFAKLFFSKSKHLAFSFNFTELPKGLNKVLMRYAFRSIDRFVVFSEAERHIYASFFSLDINKFDAIRWCMNKPKTRALNASLPEKYICAVGGEGRDYKSLVMAAQQLPNLHVVIVARPDSLAGLHPSANISVFTNLKNEEFWHVVKNASFVVLPLKDGSTNCGHISIVGSQAFGKPIVSTYSSGTSEYLQHGQNALMSAAGDSLALGVNIKRLWEDKTLYEELSSNVTDHARKHSIDNWVTYFDRYLLSTSRL
ncbi:glycosyltransferase family 4 protein [Rhodoferax sp. AJA081-3]|uniref:glycosyltransferase n=1 Tax=Rhodoferax sp. AJA081-3 TaxID=2752316 RepID=UPI001ADF0951|nr:glycosyltransferase [Rhodoferax sp. AJA081-3]QTN26852.1 glycosyltransferase family 4 protein [Rhodoferax sp. AJA081-3]